MLVKPEDMFMLPLTWRVGGEVTCIEHVFVSVDPEGKRLPRRIRICLPSDDSSCRGKQNLQMMLLAFCMGTHLRLGASSLVLQLDAGVMQIIFQIFVSELVELSVCATAVDVKECLAELGEIDLAKGY